jgi:hypothetical protein
MNIQPISANYQQNFKSAIPTVFWERTAKRVDLVHDVDLTRRLCNILVRRANGTGGKNKAAMQERKMVMDLLYYKDRDYHFAYDAKHIPNRYALAEGITGCFYPDSTKTGWKYGKFTPRVFLMTGSDYFTMRDFGETIGYESKSRDKGRIATAIENYHEKGKDLGAIPTKDELHVIVEKTKSGGYKIIKLNMYPPNGHKSPFTIMGYYA